MIEFGKDYQQKGDNVRPEVVMDKQTKNIKYRFLIVIPFQKKSLLKNWTVRTSYTKKIRTNGQKSPTMSMLTFYIN